jgi:AraC-like DNA-binding protein
MLYLAGIVITFFLAIILLSKKGKTAADHVLAAWLCVIGLHLFFYYWQLTGEIYDHPYLLGISVPMPLLQGPLLYLYIITVSRGFSKKYWLHFVPVAAAYIALSKFYRLSVADKIAVYKNEGAGFEIYTRVILLAAIISGFAYVLLSFYELKKYRKKITEEFSNTEKINLNWLRYLIYGILVIWMIILLNGSDPLIFGAVVVFVLLLGYFGIKHIGIFTYRRVIVKEIIKAGAGEDALFRPLTAVANEETILKREPMLIGQAPVRAKYEKSGLQKETADKIHQDLNLLMQTQKVFKSEELSLAQLAQQLGVHPNYLSQVINTYESKSFYDYINTLRIGEFKALVLLPENSRFTLLSLAFECGFNSKTAFNRNFKKITGLSPSEYLKEIDIQLVS